MNRRSDTTERHLRLQQPTRRGALALLEALALGTLTVACTPVQGMSTRGPTRRPIVLVHGGWHGGWCWKYVTPLLAAAGHPVYTPTLTGLGDRAHLARPELDLETHIQDLLAFLEMEDLREIMLVGHSYAGFVISAVAERARPRLHSLVYLDAFVPEHGKRVIDYLLPLERRAAILQAGQETGYIASIPLQAFGVTNEADLAWATPRIVKQPFGTFSQPIELKQPAASGLPRAFLACTNPVSGSFGQFAEMIKQDPSWIFAELATGHDAMITAPQALAEKLLALG
jgi:pimeloyl-ACP methyl ester carboxylesterase